MRMSARHTSPGLSFALGALVGAIAVFVPLTSVGHARSNVDGSGQPFPGAVPSSAPAAGPNFLWWIGDDPRLPAKAQGSITERNEAVDADSSSSIKQEPSKSNEASNEGGCDVQLD